MAKILGKVLALVGVAALAGCATQPLVVKTFSEDLPPSKFAVIKKSSQEMEGLTFSTWFAGYSRVMADQVFPFVETGNTWTGFASELQLLPGTYLLSAGCQRMGHAVVTGNGGVSYSGLAYIRLPVLVEAGQNYEVYCEAVPNRVGLVRGKYRPIPRQEEKK